MVLVFASASVNLSVPVLLKYKASALRRRSNKIWSLIKRILLGRTNCAHPKMQGTCLAPRLLNTCINCAGRIGTFTPIVLYMWGLGGTARHTNTYIIYVGQWKESPAP